MGANPDKFLTLAPKSSIERNDCRKQESGLKNGGGPKPPASRKSRKRRLPLSLLAPSAARSDLRPEPREDGADSRAATATSARSAPGEGQHCAEAPRRASAGSPRRPPHALSSCSASSLETRELAATELFPVPVRVCPCPEYRGCGVERGVECGRGAGTTGQGAVSR